MINLGGYECDGHGHRAVECGNNKYKSQKGYQAHQATWSDSDSDSQSDESEGTIALVASVTLPDESDKDEDSNLEDCQRLVEGTTQLLWADT